MERHKFEVITIEMYVPWPHEMSLSCPKKGEGGRTGSNLLPLGGKDVLCAHSEVASTVKHRTAIILVLHAVRNRFSRRSTTFTCREKKLAAA